jgi:hypothetical protein
MATSNIIDAARIPRGRGKNTALITMCVGRRRAPSRA